MLFLVSAAFCCCWDPELGLLPPTFGLILACCLLLTYDLRLSRQDLGDLVLEPRASTARGWLSTFGSLPLALALLASSPTAWLALASEPGAWVPLGVLTWVTIDRLLGLRWIGGTLRSAPGGRLPRPRRGRPGATVLVVGLTLLLYLQASWLVVLPLLLMGVGLGVVSFGLVALLAIGLQALAWPVESAVVTLGPDDQVAELAPVLAGSQLTVELVDPAAPRLVRLRGPPVGLVVAAVALAADEENVEAVELSSRAMSVPSLLDGDCRYPAAERHHRFSDPLARWQSTFFQGEVDAIASAQASWSRPARSAQLAIIDEPMHPDPDVPIRRPQGHAPSHGNRVAAVAASIADNGLGLAGPNHHGRWVEVLDVPVLHTYADQAAVSLAVRRALAEGAEVINLSLGASGRTQQLLQDAIDDALSRGVVVVVAAGNGGPYRSAADQWPANARGVLVVTALDERGQPATFATGTSGSSQVVGAPGERVCVPTDGRYGSDSGTSFAAAQVSGVLAGIRALCPSVPGPELQALAVATAEAGAGRRFRPDQLLSRLEQTGRCPGRGSRR